MKRSLMATMMIASVAATLLVGAGSASAACGYSTPTRCTSYFNSGFVGDSDWMNWGEVGRLVNTYNENASVKIT